MADKIRVLLTEEEVDKRINEVAECINKEYAGKSREKEKSFNLKKGNYEITVVSEKGETAKINFQVTEK